MKNVKRNAMRIREQIDVLMGCGEKIQLKTILILLFLCTGFFAHGQMIDQRAENVQNGLQNIFMSADQSYYKLHSNADNDPYQYGYWWTAHALENLADAYQRTRNTVYYNRMKSIIAGVRKYNRYAAGTYRNDYYDDLEWLGLAAFNCYYATKDTEFLDAVRQIWAEIKTGYSGGKMSWRKGCTTPCNNSIANSPAIVMAVKLYKLENDATNLQMAKDIHAWMKANVFNANGGIWDAPGNFDPNWQFSYNSGMFIMASLELNIVTGTQSYLDDAIKACEFVMTQRNTGNVFFLNETGQGDGGLFKGIFANTFADFIRMANLTPAQRDRYMQMILTTGNYAWERAVNKSNFLVNSNWSTMPSGTIDLSTHLAGVHLFESVASLNKVHVYRDINYSGFYSQLAPGMYTLAQLQAKGIYDNDITSLTVPVGYTVTVYENDNFSGASATYTTNQTWLASWNDRISSIRIVTNSPATYRIKNRWQNTYLYDAGDRVRYNATASGTSYQWVIEDLGGGLKELKNVATGEYMHIENLLGYVQCTPRTAGWWSSRWITEDAGGGYIRIRNHWQNTKYIHVENLQSQAQYGDLNTSWLSMQWILEPATAARQESEVDPAIVETERLHYWPNEVNDEITIQTDGSYKQVEVIDVMGRVRYHDDKIEGKKSVVMDLRHLNAGTHIVHLVGAQPATFRIVKK